MARKKKEDKRLVAFLERQNPEELIYFGTETGSNWIMIDTAENILKNLDKLNRQYYKDLERMFAKCKKALLRIPPIICEIQKQIKSTSSEEDTDKLENKLENQYRRFIRAFNSREKNGKALLYWIDISEREVVEVYQHTDEVPGMSVRIKGTENGRFWTKAEYDRQTV